mmetsp:Transcript_1687/g.2741  ORF Transcript_1687/g.2741 Transcript_1687/m.2741 type:complete len:301 (-) Transcript_1687:1061-1963(-)
MPRSFRRHGRFGPVLAGLIRIATRRIPRTTLLILLQKGKASLDRQPVRFVVHRSAATHILILNRTNGLTIFKRHHTATTPSRTTDALDTVRYIAPLVAPPGFQNLEALHSNILSTRIQDNVGPTRRPKTSTTIIAHTHLLNGSNGRAIVFTRSSLGLLTPHRQIHTGIALIDQGQITLEQLLLCALTRNRPHRPHALDHSQQIRISIHLTRRLQRGNVIYKFIHIALNAPIILDLMYLRIGITGNFEPRFARIPLHIGHLQFPSTNCVDVVEHHEVIEPIDRLLKEGCPDIGTAVIEQIE